jgi:hypothetical protein
MLVWILHMECEITQQIQKKVRKLKPYMEIEKKPPWAYLERGVSFCKDTQE